MNPAPVVLSVMALSDISSTVEFPEVDTFVARNMSQTTEFRSTSSSYLNLGDGALKKSDHEILW